MTREQLKEYVAAAIYAGNTSGAYWHQMTPAFKEEFYKAADRMIANIAEFVTPADIRTDIHLIFDGPPNADGPRFIEAEDSEGRSINIGEWRDREDGYWELVIKRGVRAEEAGRDE